MEAEWGRRRGREEEEEGKRALITKHLTSRLEIISSGSFGEEKH